jgi:hypothetical protein
MLSKELELALEQNVERNEDVIELKRCEKDSSFSYRGSYQVSITSSLEVN